MPLLVFGNHNLLRCNHICCHLLSVGLEPIICKTTQRKHVGADGNILYLDIVRMSWVLTLCTTDQIIRII